MPLGPGKYDDICTLAREHAGIGIGDNGGVLVVVIGGNRGSGFSYQGDPSLLTKLPDTLENVAQMMRVRP